MASRRASSLKPSARRTGTPRLSPGKWASARMISSPWPIRQSVARRSGESRGEMPLSMAGVSVGVRIQRLGGEVTAEVVGWGS